VTKIKKFRKKLKNKKGGPNWTPRTSLSQTSLEAHETPLMPGPWRFRRVELPMMAIGISFSPLPPTLFFILFYFIFLLLLLFFLLFFLFFCSSFLIGTTHENHQCKELLSLLFLFLPLRFALC